MVFFSPFTAICFIYCIIIITMAIPSFASSLVKINSSRDQSIIKIENAYIFWGLFYFLFLSSIKVSCQISIRFSTNIFSTLLEGWDLSISMVINNIICLAWYAWEIIFQITIMFVICIIISSPCILYCFVPVNKSKCYSSLN